MRWYMVVKTINGHRYRYRQKTWREGDKVRTHSVYVGRAVGAVLSKILAGADETRPRPARLVLNGEEGFIAELLSGSDQTFKQSYSWRGKGSLVERPFKDPEVIMLPVKLGVKVVSLLSANRVSCPTYDAQKHRILIPDVSRYRTVATRSAEDLFTHDLLHECVHALSRKFKRPLPHKVGFDGSKERMDVHAREEIVAEVGSSLVMRRLGLETDINPMTQAYIQQWKRRLKDEDIIWAIERAKQSADDIIKVHSLWKRSRT